MSPSYLLVNSETDKQTASHYRLITPQRSLIGAPSATTDAYNTLPPLSRLSCYSPFSSLVCFPVILPPPHFTSHTQTYMYLLLPATNKTTAYKKIADMTCLCNYKMLAC